MKKVFGLNKRITGLFAVLILASSLTTFTGCKKDKAPVGRFMFYTFLDNSKFDVIKIYVDGKHAGDITLTHIERPECGTASTINVINVPLAAGSHSWYAKQMLNGQEVDEWDERDETITEGECNYIKLTD